MVRKAQSADSHHPRIFLRELGSSHRFPELRQLRIAAGCKYAYIYASSVKQEGVAPCSETPNCVAYSNIYLARKQTRNDAKLPSLAKRPLAGSVEKTATRGRG